jgi:hypothetical protein
VVRSSGIDGLIKELQAKNKVLERKPPPPVEKK